MTKPCQRPDGKGGSRAVAVNDACCAVLRFDNGATGSIEGNWIATGLKMQHEFEVCGKRVLA